MLTPPPKALDLFCGAGGAARGLQLAGYYVTGVDIDPQPWYAGDEFVRGDALDLEAIGIELSDYDLVWASPPCQAYSHASGPRKRESLDLIPATRELVAGHPAAIIENVPPAPLRPDVILEWGMFVSAPPIPRRRVFELTCPPPLTPPRLAPLRPSLLCATGTGSSSGVRERRMALGLPQKTPVADLRTAFGADWIPADAPVTHQRRALNQMVPPIYAQWLAQRIGERR